jgi:hypothetical protein
MSRSLHCLLALVLAAAAWSAPLRVTPPGKVAFNWPSPPQVGAPGYFAIAAEGQPRCCLVITSNTKPQETMAASMLATYLKLITGADFATVREDAVPAGLGQIHLGDTAVAQQTPLNLPPLQYGNNQMPNVNGFLVKTVSPTVLVIRGGSDRGVLNGVVGLLKRCCGVRRYWPGEPGGLGDVVPGDASLKLPQLEWRDWPYFISTTMSGTDDRGPKAEKFTAASFYDFWRLNATIPSNESYFQLLDARHRTNEPDLFPLINGKRFIPAYEPGQPDPNGWQPCVSNPRVVQLMAEYILNYFRTHPDAFALNLAVNDGYGDCTCPNCQAMDAPGADRLNRIGLCDRYVKFDNQVAELVAKEFPDKILAFIAYGSMRQPPATVKLHPMLMPVLCVWDNAFQMWDDWRQMGAKHMGLYLYHDDIWFIMPKLDVHQSAKRIRYVVGSGEARHFYQEFYGIYPLDGMVGYVEQELLWDPRISEDQVLAEYYRQFYGPAAGAMKQFYDLVEKGYGQWLEVAGKPHPYGKDLSPIQQDRSLEQFAVLPTDYAQQGLGYLRQAQQAAAGNETVRRRVDLVNQTFQFAAFGSKLYWADRRLQELAVRTPAQAEQMIQEARAALRSGQELARYKLRVMEQPELRAYEQHENSDEFYQGLKEGSVDPDVVNHLAGALSRATAGMRQSLPQSQVVTWWQQRQQAEHDPLLAGLLGAAAFDAGGQQLPNAVADPGYEDRAVRHAAAGSEQADGQSSYGGANVWSGAGSPMTCAFATDQAHGGKYSFAFTATQHAGVCERLDVKPGEIVRMSVWVRFNGQPGTYTVQTLPRGEGDLARTTVKLLNRPDQWQQANLTFVAPPGAKTVDLWVFVDQQGPGAKLWVDDWFIAKHPAP